MVGDDDLDVFLSLGDFGQTVVMGGITGVGILDEPGQIIAGGMQVSNDYSVMVRTDLFGQPASGIQISVGGVPFTVRESKPETDGKFMNIFLSKV